MGKPTEYKSKRENIRYVIHNRINYRFWSKKPYVYYTLDLCYLGHFEENTGVPDCDDDFTKECEECLAKSENITYIRQLKADLEEQHNAD